MSEERSNIDKKLKEIKEFLHKISDLVGDLPAEYRKTAFSEILKCILEKILDCKNIYYILYNKNINEKISENIDLDISRKTSQTNEIIEELSIIDFIDKLKIKPKNNAEWITVFAYYKKYYQNEKLFTIKEIANYFKFAGLKIPANINRDASIALQKHLIALDISSEDKKTKRYYITRRGEELVRGMLKGERK